MDSPSSLWIGQRTGEHLEDGDDGAQQSVEVHPRDPVLVAKVKLAAEQLSRYRVLEFYGFRVLGLRVFGFTGFLTGFLDIYRVCCLLFGLGVLGLGLLGFFFPVWVCLEGYRFLGFQVLGL
jgi:hypothetical protein